MAILWRDWRCGARRLGRQPNLTLVTMLTLSLGANMVLFNLVAGAPSAATVAFAQNKTAERELIKLHQNLLRFHLRGEVESWLAAEAERYVLVNRGEVTHPSKQERAARMGPYLKRTTFTEYRDLIEPEVRISQDGSLAWVIAQVKATGTQTTADGKQTPLAFTSAWIELYEKKTGQWLSVGNVSNFKPEDNCK